MINTIENKIDNAIDFINRLTEFQGDAKEASPISLQYFMDIDGFGKFKKAMKKAFPNVSFDFIHPDERVFSFSNPIMQFGSVYIKYRHDGKVYKTIVMLNLNAPIEYNVGKVVVKMKDMMISSRIPSNTANKIKSFLNKV